MGAGTQELNRYNIAEPQNEQNTLPNTVASAGTVAPVHKLTFLTGQVQLATITPPMSGYHQLVLCFTHAAPGAFLTSGNIKTAYQPIQDRPITLHYDPSTAKYWVAAVV
jgi:hypothetical protein